LGTSHSEYGSGAEIALAALAHWRGKDFWRSCKSVSQEEETMKTAIAFLIFGALQLAAQDMQSCPMAQRGHERCFAAPGGCGKKTAMKQWASLMKDHASFPALR
jgi:hypothetical protein